MKPLVALLLMTALLLAAIAGLVLGLGVAEPLVPDPESVVQGFLSPLSARRYSSAQQALDDELKQQLDVDALRELDNGLTRNVGSYEFRLGGQENEQGRQASYRARVWTERRGEQEYEFELERSAETGLWQISSLADLQAAAQE